MAVDIGPNDPLRHGTRRPARSTRGYSWLCDIGPTVKLVCKDIELQRRRGRVVVSGSPPAFWAICRRRRHGGVQRARLVGSGGGATRAVCPRSNAVCGRIAHWARRGGPGGRPVTVVASIPLGLDSHLSDRRISLVAGQRDPPRRNRSDVRRRRLLRRRALVHRGDASPGARRP